MRTTNTTIEMDRTININEILLPTVMQWSTSYQIYAMAHDHMPSSFDTSIGFGKERSCARKFCYATTVAGPDIKLSMTADDGNGLLGRRKNIR